MTKNTWRISEAIDRRSVLQALCAGVGVPGVVDSAWATQESVPHYRPGAENIIVLYMSGGYSHVDTFDPKPQLTQNHDVSIGSEASTKVVGSADERFLKAPLWKFRPNPHCGTEVSELFPHIREMMHEAALIRSMNSDHSDHGEATLMLHTGSTTVAMPSLGSWLSFGLKSSYNFV